MEEALAGAAAAAKQNTTQLLELYILHNILASIWCALQCLTVVLVVAPAASLVTAS